MDYHSGDSLTGFFGFEGDEFTIEVQQVRRK